MNVPRTIYLMYNLRSVQPYMKQFEHDCILTHYFALTYRHANNINWASPFNDF